MLPHLTHIHDLNDEQLECRTMYFLAACRMWKPDIDLEQTLQECPHGGKIGMGDSSLDTILHHSKVFRLHAIFHDSAGYVKTRYGTGPGYCYILPRFPINSCFLGHLSGLAYCLYLKWFDADYSKLDC